MPIIIISSDSYKTGRHIGEKTAKAAGYEYVDREILGSVCEKIGVPEEKLMRALGKASSFFGISPKIRNKYLTHIQVATLEQLRKDNVVCHGLAAHLYVLGISHAIKVRVLSDPRELVRQLSSGEALLPEKVKKRVKREEAKQRRWSLEAFGQDETDPSNYDLVISLSQIDPDEAVKTIAETTGYRKFQPMTYSIKCLQDKVLAGRVRAALLDRFSDARVQADGSTILVETKAVKREKQKRAEAIRKLAAAVEGVGDVEVRVADDILRQAAESLR